MAKFNKGQLVFDRIYPNQKLVVMEVRGVVYTCKVQERPSQKPLTYFERDLKAEDSPDSNKPNNEQPIVKT